MVEWGGSMAGGTVSAPVPQQMGLYQMLLFSHTSKIIIKVSAMSLGVFIVSAL